MTSVRELSFRPQGREPPKRKFKAMKIKRSPFSSGPVNTAGGIGSVQDAKRGNSEFRSMPFSGKNLRGSGKFTKRKKGKVNREPAQWVPATQIDIS